MEVHGPHVAGLDLGKRLSTWHVKYEADLDQNKKEGLSCGSINPGVESLTSAPLAIAQA